MQGNKGAKREKSYVAYLLLSFALFLLYLFLFNGYSVLFNSPSSGVATVGGAASTGPRSAERFPGFPVDLNTASADELTVLPGIGTAIAGRIVEARKARREQGGFSSVDDLLEVKWIGRVKLETLRPLVTVKRKE